MPKSSCKKYALAYYPKGWNNALLSVLILAFKGQEVLELQTLVLPKIAYRNQQTLLLLQAPLKISFPFDRP